jgi:hypothetical protein
MTACQCSKGAGIREARAGMNDIFILMGALKFPDATA